MSIASTPESLYLRHDAGMGERGERQRGIPRTPLCVCSHDTSTSIRVSMGVEEISCGALFYVLGSSALILALGSVC